MGGFGPLGLLLSTCIWKCLFFHFPLGSIYGISWNFYTYSYQVPKFDPIKCSTIHVGFSIVVPWESRDGPKKIAANSSTKEEGQAHQQGRFDVLLVYPPWELTVSPQKMHFWVDDVGATCAQHVFVAKNSPLLVEGHGRRFAWARQTRRGHFFNGFYAQRIHEWYI